MATRGYTDKYVELVLPNGSIVGVHPGDYWITDSNEVVQVDPGFVVADEVEEGFVDRGGTFQPAAEEVVEVVDLTGKTVPELKNVAHSLGIEGYKSMKKAELVEMIEAAWHGEPVEESNGEEAVEATS